MDDYDRPRGAAIGRLTHSTNDAGASSNWRIDGIRILRDLVMYAEPHYDEAVDLRARFFDLQKDHVIPRSTQRALLQILRWTPDFVRRALDRFLRRQDERTPAPAAAHVIDSLKPDYVVATPLVNFASREVDLVKAARARGIPTLLAVASWDNLTNKGRIKIEPDRVAVWNEAMAREAVELHGIARDRVWITGAPVFDPWFGRSPAQGREAFLRALHLDLDRPLLVYLCSSHSIAGNREREIVKRWLRRIRKHRDLASANVIIRPHPMASGTWAEVVTPNEHGMPSMLNAVVWPFEPKHPTTPQTRAEFFDTLFHADAIVGLNTSAMIEAAILGRPVFTFVGHEQAQSQVGNLHFRHLAGGGFVNRAENLDEHIEQLAQLGRRESVEAGVRFVDTFVRPLGRDVEAAATLAGMILGEMRVSRSASAPDDEAVLSAAESPSRA
jgi:hypothetical protein